MRDLQSDLESGTAKAKQLDGGYKVKEENVNGLDGVLNLTSQKGAIVLLISWNKC